MFTLLYILAFLVACAVGWHLSDLYGSRPQIFEVETLKQRCQMDEARVWSVHRTGVPDYGLPTVWNYVALNWTRLEVEVFIVENVWGSHGEKAKRYRLNQSRHQKPISKLLEVKNETYANAA